MKRFHPRELREDADRRDGGQGPATEKRIVPGIVPGIVPVNFNATLKCHVFREYEDRDGGVPAWRSLPEIPTSAEILGTLQLDAQLGDLDLEEDSSSSTCKEGPKLGNIIDRPWPDKESYLKAHYELLREDGVAPLRTAVSRFLAQPSMDDDSETCIYDHVHIIAYTFSNAAPAAKVQFSSTRAGKKIRWSHSSRLQQGNIVALSPAKDGFKKICKVAVVAARPMSGLEKNPPELDLFWANAYEAELDPTEEYTMIEARCDYFEAYRHMLVALQKLMTEKFPLSEIFVQLENTDLSSQLALEQPMMDLRTLSQSPEKNVDDYDMLDVVRSSTRHLESVDVLKPLPSIPESSMDPSQLSALHRMLTKKIAIVQGPPGTGKTFVSISALTIMLRSWMPGDAPIMIAAQTNHALDQILTLLEPITPLFIRLGGRMDKENKFIKERTLWATRQRATNAAKAPYTEYRNKRQALEELTAKLKVTLSRAMQQSSAEAGVLLEMGIITQTQYDSLHDGDWASVPNVSMPEGVLAAWLGPDQINFEISHCPPTSVWLEEEELDPEYEALVEDEAERGLTQDDDDADVLIGQIMGFREEWTGRVSLSCSLSKIRRLLDTKGNLWDIKPALRGEVYNFFRRRVKEEASLLFRRQMAEYLHAAKGLKVARWQSDATMILRLGIKIVACTTTGLSKYRGLIAALRPRRLLVEEAAETLEGSVVAAMAEDIEQLILVGDHQQLRPSCTMQHHATPPYNLTVSLFERLVTNGISFSKLDEQRRMIPEVRELLNPFYPSLRDHTSVRDREVNRKPIPAMGGRDTYFFHHQWSESRDESTSCYNREEAEMIAGFFTYLVLNGVAASQITVLTFYNGQRKCLIKCLKKQPNLTNLGRLNVCTVDSYQGEENDIILLSLVRSNARGTIGFLENKNRAVVALSRARRGLYVFGDITTMMSVLPTSYSSLDKDRRFWHKVLDVFCMQGNIDDQKGLPVTCTNHNQETVIADPADWNKINGGCTRKCGGMLPCGHACLLKCHPFSHDEILCRATCSKMCPCGHACAEQCGDICRCSICNQTPRPTTQVTEVRETISQGRETFDNATAVNAIRIWKGFDPVESDRELDSSRLSQRAAGTPNVGCVPIFIDIHRAVSVKDGIRRGTSTSTTDRVLRQALPRTTPRLLIDLPVSSESTTALRSRTQLVDLLDSFEVDENKQDINVNEADSQESLIDLAIPDSFDRTPRQADYWDIQTQAATGRRVMEQMSVVSSQECDEAEDTNISRFQTGDLIEL